MHTNKRFDTCTSRNGPKLVLKGNAFFWFFTTRSLKMQITSLLVLFVGVVVLATPSFADYYKPPKYEPKPPYFKPPKVEKPFPEHKPPVYKPPKIEKPPVYKPPKIEKPPPFHKPLPPYGHYPGHPPVENAEYIKPKNWIKLFIYRYAGVLLVAENKCHGWSSFIRLSSAFSISISCTLQVRKALVETSLLFSCNWWAYPKLYYVNQWTSFAGIFMNIFDLVYVVRAYDVVLNV